MTHAANPSIERACSGLCGPLVSIVTRLKDSREPS